VFYQWIMCSAIWIAGLIVNCIQHFPPFQPLAMLGGFLWCTGNILAVPIVQMIGLGLGMLLWGSSNLVMGWASGNFGLFGLKAQTVPFPALNYVGVAFALGSIGIFVLVKSNDAVKPQSGYDRITNEETPIVSSMSVQEPQESGLLKRLGPLQRRILGTVLALISGIFYGLNFDPPQYLMDHNLGSENGLDYVFSHFSGIYLTSTLYFLIYCMVKKNQPIVNPKAILPGFLSGVLWAIADISWFIANSMLGFVVSFPIITTGPGLVASLWAIFVFKEITGRRNYIILIIAFLTTAVGVTLITLSKILTPQ